MAAELRDEFGLKADLVRSGGGVFEVTLDGELLFSKKTLGRFPEPGEVENAIRSTDSTDS